ncbi:MAG: hypothetical protein LIO65_01040 [Odoribacter sp.]|nr:hypothetical protein [Odoribacter sp.]
MSEYIKRKIHVICILWIIGCIIIGCDNQTIGYLQTENAKYIPDTVQFKAVLDTTKYDDLQRFIYEVPWQSSSIEGVQGTAPIVYSIHSIESDITDESILSQFSMWGKGVLLLPYNHTVPIETYTINLKVENEGHSHILEAVLTVIMF